MVSSQEGVAALPVDLARGWVPAGRGEETHSVHRTVLPVYNIHRLGTGHLA